MNISASQQEYLRSPEPKVICCITPQVNAKRLIDAASEMAEILKCELHLIHVAKGKNALAEGAAELLSSLFTYATKSGGITHGLSGDDPAEVIIDFIKKERITHAVIGEPDLCSVFGTIGLRQKIETLMPYIIVKNIPAS